MLRHLLLRDSTYTSQLAFGSLNRLLPPSSFAANNSSNTRQRHFCSMAHVPKDEYDKQWFETWHNHLQPGEKFDAGRCSPLLTHLLSSGKLQVQGKKTIVPGCGRGYDAFAFALSGAAVSVGLDLCPEAIAAAKEEQQVELASHPAASSAVHLVAGDFFSHGSNAESKGPFDVGYDYTFLCALHPDMRQDWAKAWAEIIAPAGELVTLIFPIGANPPGAPQNPPWPVTPELYQELLLPAGFEQVVLEPVPLDMSHKPRAGREWLGRWRRVGGDSSTDSSSHSSRGRQQRELTPGSNL